MAWLFIAIGVVCLSVLILRLIWGVFLLLLYPVVLVIAVAEFALHALWRLLSSSRR